MAACVECMTPLTGPQCAKCGLYSLAPTTIGGLAGNAIQETDLVDVTSLSATKIKRIVTGTPFDLVWGPPNDPGFVPKTTSVLTGLPGSGKSTLCLQLVPIFARLTGKPGYYVSGENEKEELAFTLNRLQIKLEPGQLRLVNSMKSSGVIDQAVLTKSPPGLIIVDSLSTLAGGKNYDAQDALIRFYKTIATTFDCVVLCVAQQNKQQTTLGTQSLQHNCDCVVEVDTMEKDYRRRDRVLREHCIEGSPDLRACVCYKNRNGPTFEYVYLVMGPHGLEALPPPPKETILKSADALADLVIACDECDEEEAALRARLTELKTERAERRGKLARAAASRQRAAPAKPAKRSAS